jgi:hypothetical protein
MKRESGTTIEVLYNEAVWDTIKDQIHLDSEGGYLDISKSLVFRYGRYPRDVSVCLFEKDQKYRMKSFNPSADTLFEKRDRRIDVYRHENRLRFIGDKNEEFKKAGKGVSTVVSHLSRTEMEELGERIGSLDVICYIPNDPNYTKDFINAKAWAHPHLQKIFHKHKPKDIQLASRHPGVFRYGYRLGTIDLQASTESIRSNYEARLYYDIQTDVLIQGSSEVDTMMGTQENKGQYIDTSPTGVKRLVDYFKQDYKSFVLSKLIGIYPKPVKPEPAPMPEPPALRAEQPEPIPEQPEPKPDPPVPRPLPKAVIVHPHKKGYITDEDFTMLIEYLAIHKEEMQRDTAFITFFNSITKRR